MNSIHNKFVKVLSQIANIVYHILKHILKNMGNQTIFLVNYPFNLTV